MKSVLLGVILLATPAAAATDITVVDLGTVLNDSISFPSTHTPGSGQAFDFYFEFTTPVAETLTASMSDSAGTPAEQIKNGVLSLSTWTSTSGAPLFVPMGTVIDTSPIVNFPGGQVATAGPNFEQAGKYFGEITGVSGGSTLKLAIDGNVTAIPQVPEMSTWAMMAIGFACFGFVRFRRDARFSL